MGLCKASSNTPRRSKLGKAFIPNICMPKSFHASRHKGKGSCWHFSSRVDREPLH